MDIVELAEDGSPLVRTAQAISNTYNAAAPYAGAASAVYQTLGGPGVGDVVDYLGNVVSDYWGPSPPQRHIPQQLFTTAPGQFIGPTAQQRSVGAAPLYGMDLKFKDYWNATGGQTLLNTGGTFILANPTPWDNISSVEQGTTSSQCIGRTYTIRKLDISFTWSQLAGNQGGTEAEIPQDNDIWVAVVLDKQTNGVEMDPEDVYLPHIIYSPTVNGENVPSPLRDLNHTDRFEVLRLEHRHVKAEWRWDSSGDFTISPKRSGRIDFHISGLNIKVARTVGVSGDQIDTIQDNSIHIIACSSYGGIYARSMFEFNTRTRMRFV